MAVNTTRHLVADMERLREHLGIDAWLLYGGSWGSTLILAYAERHPERVRGVVIAGVTMTRPSETDWLYRGVARFLPAQWDRFRSFAGSDDVVRAYARLMEDPDLEVRQRAAAEWVAWEDAVIAHETNGSPGAYRARVDEARLAFVRICTHYFAHDAWLDDDELLRNAHRLRRIPGVLIHGRLDLGSPLRSAWELQRAWPAADLVVIDDDGHTGGDATRSEVLIATDRFAQTSPL
jgi:proline iminopeptidase